MSVPSPSQAVSPTADEQPQLLQAQLAAASSDIKVEAVEQATSSDSAPQPSPHDAYDAMSEWRTLRAHVDENPYNGEAWNAFVDKAEDSGDLDKIKEAYEALLQTYPNTVRELSLSLLRIETTKLSSRL